MNIQSTYSITITLVLIILVHYLNVNLIGFNMDLVEIGFDRLDWIRLAQDRYRWRALDTR
jgi:hypothetical protein